MDLLLQKIAEQLVLVGISVLTAILIGVPLGIFSRYSRSFQSIILGFAGVMQTIPSLALLALLLPVWGIGMTPAIIAMILYALLPILRNTAIAFQQIPLDYIEAARGLGASSLQCLWKIELPLALPVIIAGIRTSVSMTVGIATIAAFIGAGGLGDFITRGLAMNNPHLLLIGAIPAALLALVLDGLFAHFQQKPKHILWLIFVILLTIFYFFYVNKNYNYIRIGTKNFTEQYILGEITAQLIEAKTSLKVERKFNLGTTEICHSALKKGDIDIYPEYTGTAYMTILHRAEPQNAEQMLEILKQAYEKQFHIAWLSPLGFNNAQSLTVRQDFARRYHLQTISDLAPMANQLTIAAQPEFLDRSDAYPALQKSYHLKFKQIKAMEPGLLYPAIAHHAVDIINAFTTDGRIPAYRLQTLQDVQQAFPAYQASLLVRESVLKSHPELRTVLNLLSNQLDTQTMQQLNAEVDIHKLSPAAAAHNFLAKKGLI